MILHGLGACLITRLIRAERGDEIEADSLLTETEVVEPPEDEAAAQTTVWLLAAE